MKKVLLLTDFSENSINAMRYALQLFKNEICDFYVLNVQDSRSYTSDDLMLSRGNQSLYQSLISDNKRKLKTIVGQLKLQANERLHNFKSIVDYDVFLDSIKQIIAKYHVDLIVMGTNGASNLKETLFGSSALKVLRNIDCNTLVVPDEFKYKQPKKLLLALDSDDYIDHITVKEIFELMEHLDAKIEIKRYVTSKDNINATINSDNSILLELIDQDKFTYDVVTGMSLSSILINSTKPKDTDIITLVGQFKGFFERLFGTPSKTEISKHLDCPLMIFHN
ncbi:universal stress protein [Winogradskyella alexanderae]|uniref:Universal stress protein n=1 Tax=Winogradskyella alexanderae TaxID=2877123 RepID=A0ABS7XY13_9FLAO|nr:universal stress protein [Winogradskyella alexanderae]MCA0133747.1 universal stress protein [Winogradskyella alexanderae]